VSSGTVGVLPGPLGLLFSSGTGWMVFSVGFVITVSVSRVEETPAAWIAFPRTAAIMACAD
jgi:hypothetical protein